MNAPNARVRVTVQIEITRHCAWPADCQVSQVYKQGSREALEDLNRLLSGATPAQIQSAFRVVGEPQVEAVITTASK